MNVRAFAALLVVLCLVLTASRTGAQAPADFGQSLSRDIVVPSFTDVQVTRLMTTLDSRLAIQKDETKWADDASATLSAFTKRLQTGQLTATQETRVLRDFGDIGRAHPADAAILDGPRHVISALTVGKTAPDIVGTDLDGGAFHLSDYRGKVVVLVFSAEWCGICRSEYPYERLLLELYHNWPFALLGVNADSDRTVARNAKAAQGLTYRSWWDGGPDGPIASAWAVTGLPAVYVLDGHGVIRFVDLRSEDLLKGVRQLLTEQTLRTSLVNAQK